MILKKFKDFIANRAIKHYFLATMRNFAFKLFLVGFIIFFAFSIAIFFIEKDYIKYKEVDGKKVEDTDNSSNIRTFEDSIWWAIVTSTTVGYGDYFPKSFIGRIVGILMMFFGMALVGVITGNIASLFVEKQLKEGRGLKELKLKNHFIICGWKRDMGTFLHEVMDKNKSFLPSEFVLINAAEPELIENLRTDAKFKHINFIHGDYIDEQALRRANIKFAKKVLVLADRLIPGSIEEVDSHTVMAIITIKSIAKSAYTCAELLDSKFERYLRLSNCDEIILSSENNRSLLATASTGSGISHVIGELLNVRAEASINTIEIPVNYIGKTFNELSTHIVEKNHSILIGILENTGNFLERKKAALREAQKTPDISKLVDNLKMVKELIANQPIINPEPSYIIKNYSRAIIIEGRGHY
jgi:voltage-gated potassium channel